MIMQNCKLKFWLYDFSWTGQILLFKNRDMKQWEYYVFDEDWDAEDRELMNVCNTLGDAGWELVSTHEKSKVGDDGPFCRLVFKRKKTKDWQQRATLEPEWN